MGGIELRWNNRFFEERGNLLRTQVFPGSFGAPQLVKDTFLLT